MKKSAEKTRGPGKPPIYGERLRRRVHVSITDDQALYLSRLGKGNVAAAVRSLIDEAMGRG